MEEKPSVNIKITLGTRMYLGRKYKKKIWQELS